MTRQPSKKVKAAAVAGGVIIHDEQSWIIVTPAVARRLADELHSMADLADGIKAGMTVTMQTAGREQVQ